MNNADVTDPAVRRRDLVRERLMVIATKLGIDNTIPDQMREEDVILLLLHEIASAIADHETRIVQIEGNRRRDFAR